MYHECILLNNSYTKLEFLYPISAPVYSNIIWSESVIVTCLKSEQLNIKLVTHFYNFMDKCEKIHCTMFNLIRNVYYLDLGLWKGPRSYLNIAIEIPCLTSYLMVIVMFSISITISKIFAVEIVHDHDLDLWNGSRSNTNMPIETPS